MAETQRGSVLLIEDEANIAEAIRFILGRDGWQVQHLAEATRAMAEMRARPPAVLVLDLMLPGMSGLELLAQIRAEESLKDLPVLMLTARGQGRDREAAALAGAAEFLAKPFANSELLACVNALAPALKGAH